MLGPQRVIFLQSLKYSQRPSWPQGVITNSEVALECESLPFPTWKICLHGDVLQFPGEVTMYWIAGSERETYSPVLLG
jgi:hypothetical protein